VQWEQRGSHSLVPYDLPGGYVNLLDESEEERVPVAFGSNFERLVNLKRMYDPDNVFR